MDGVVIKFDIVPIYLWDPHELLVVTVMYFWIMTVKTDLSTDTNEETTVSSWKRLCILLHTSVVEEQSVNWKCHYAKLILHFESATEKKKIILRFLQLQ